MDFYPINNSYTDKKIKTFGATNLHSNETDGPSGNNWKIQTFSLRIRLDICFN